LSAAIESYTVIVTDDGHAADTQLRFYGTFSAPGDRCNALLVEYGQHWQADTAAVAVDIACRFLLELGMVGIDDTYPHLLTAQPVPDRWIEVPHAIGVTSDQSRMASGQIAIQFGRYIDTPATNNDLLAADED
jgi:hypothetical protein